MRHAGIDVEYCSIEHRGEPDLDLLRRAHRLERFVLTQDRDFVGLVLRDRHPTFGVVLLSVPTKGGWTTRASGLAALVIAAAAEALGGIVEVRDGAFRRLAVTH
jgi:hypothetical protein